MYQFLIDECLTPVLVKVAVDAGYVAQAVPYIGLQGSLDHEILAYAVEHDLILVTNNARDFRGASRSAPGGLYAKQEVHPGLVCLISDKGMSLPRSVALFEAALAELAKRHDMVNTAVEVHEDLGGQLRVEVYDIP
jgi:hypothetical protein